MEPLLPYVNEVRVPLLRPLLPELVDRTEDLVVDVLEVFEEVVGRRTRREHLLREPIDERCLLFRCVTRWCTKRPPVVLLGTTPFTSCPRFSV